MSTMTEGQITDETADKAVVAYRKIERGFKVAIGVLCAVVLAFDAWLIWLIWF